MGITPIKKLAILKKTVKIKDKLSYISSNSNDAEFLMLLYYALNPQITFKISEATLRGKVSKESDESNFGSELLGQMVRENGILEVCDFLSSPEIKALNSETISRVKRFVYSLEGEERELCIQLLAKTLRLGITGVNVNKVIPNLIPTWEIQQAFPIDKYPLKPDAEFVLTQKLNGVRATYYKGKLYSRTGTPYEGLEHIIKAFDFDTNFDVVYDGELTLKNKTNLSDNEAFRVSTGIINSENADKTGICYTIFDALPTSEFEKGESADNYAFRRSYLDSISDFIRNRSDGYVTVLPVLYRGKDQGVISELLSQMVREDKEGLMVNLVDSPYKCKRHKGILKVKRFYTLDLPIIRCEEGSGRLSDTLGAFVLDYKGNEVNVGSGFTDEQRKYFWDKRDDLIGTLCEVKYKEISSNKITGAESLQFPIFISLREDKNEVSYG